MTDIYHVSMALTLPASVSPWSVLPIVSERADNLMRSLFAVVQKSPMSGESTDRTEFKRMSYPALRDAFSDHGLEPQWLTENWHGGPENDPIRDALHLQCWLRDGVSDEIQLRLLAVSKTEADRLTVESVRMLEAVCKIKKWKGAALSVSSPVTHRTSKEGDDAPALNGPLPEVSRRSPATYFRDVVKRYLEQIIVGVVIALAAGVPLAFLAFWLSS